MKEEYIEKGILKLYKETDSMSVNLSRILIELAGLIKKRKGKISLTKTEKKRFKIIFDYWQLFLRLLQGNLIGLITMDMERIK